MNLLSFPDYLIIALYIFIALLTGFWYSKKAAENTESFFLAGRSLPWWLLGISMAATTFAADTPLAITEIVRTDGIWGNWLWWCWGIAWVFSSVFVAPLWRRSNVITDAGIIELRYDKGATALRYFSAIYFGIVLNIIIIAWVIGAMSTIMSIVTGWPLLETAIVLMFIALVYSLLSGLWGVVVTDLLQLIIALIGTLLFAIYSWKQLPVPWSEVLTTISKRNPESLKIIPGSDMFIWGFLFFLFVQWWAFYQSSLNVYFAQRIAACRSPKDSYKASLLFNVINFSIRHWPWVVIAVISLYIWPTKDSLRKENLNLVLDHHKFKVSQILQKEHSFTKKKSAEIFFQNNKKIRENNLYSGLNNQYHKLLSSKSLSGLKQKFSNVLQKDFKISKPKSIKYIQEITKKNKTIGIAETKLEFKKILSTLAVEKIVQNTSGLKSGQYQQSAYPLLMRRLPAGLLGLVLVALLSAFMSTIDTHLNWGASYIINDIYLPLQRKRKIKLNKSLSEEDNTKDKNIDDEKENKKQVLLSRLAMIFLFVLALIVSFLGESVYSLWHLLFGLTAGMGFVYLLRWFWAGINAYSEIACLSVGALGTIILTIYSNEFSSFIQNDLQLQDKSLSAIRLMTITFFSVFAAVLTALFMPKVSEKKLNKFREEIKPSFWFQNGRVYFINIKENLISFVSGLGIVFGLLFAIYQLLFADFYLFIVFLSISIISSLLIYYYGRNSVLSED